MTALYTDIGFPSTRQPEKDMQIPYLQHGHLMPFAHPPGHALHGKQVTTATTAPTNIVTSDTANAVAEILDAAAQLPLPLGIVE